MEIITAKSAGFCFGVKRAVDEVYKRIDLEQEQPIYTYGPIIHNQEVTNDLGEKGVSIVSDSSELDNLENGIVIIRSHGVSENVSSSIKEKGFKCVDATCPYVKKIHKIVQRKSEAGDFIVIIGNENHPEVQGIMGWVKTNVKVVQSVQEAHEFELTYSQKISIVSQTTFNYKKFQDIVDIISKKSYDIDILNTICGATKERQAEAYEIATVVDAMIVIGDKQSSNSQKLFEICKKACKNTQYIQTVKDLDFNKLSGFDKIGITAGASTPNNIIKEVQINVRIKL